MLRISEFQKKYGVKVTTNHNDKMQGLASLSTAPTKNPLCIERAKNPDTICSHCYSMVMNKRFKNLREMLEKNTDILTTTQIPVEDLPKLFSETGYFRFEAFGDLMSEIQVVNYFNIAKYNPHMKCAIWTKNPWFISGAMRHYGITKPENLTILVSSYFVNCEMSEFLTKYPWIDKVFTVYDKQFIEKNGIEVNCGGRACADCGRCYENKGGAIVNEQLK